MDQRGDATPSPKAADAFQIPLRLIAKTTGHAGKHSGGSVEWHEDINKYQAKNDIGEKGLTCLDGVEQRPIFGKEAYGCDFLTRDGCVSKSGFLGASICRTVPCPSVIF